MFAGETPSTLITTNCSKPTNMSFVGSGGGLMIYWLIKLYVLENSSDVDTEISMLSWCTKYTVVNFHNRMLI